MRRSRIQLIGVAVLLAVLIPAGGASAANKATEHFVAKLRHTSCTHTGAFYGYGSVDTTARIVEKGRHGTNYLVLRASFQRRTGGAWHTVASFGPYRSESFPNNADNHAFTQPFAWAIRAEDVGHVFRWRVRFQWWDKKPGADIRITEKVRLTDACHA
jgi:hypothetical protein